jgi:hypothetical protein
VKFEEIGMIDDIKFITGIINSPQIQRKFHINYQSTRLLKREIGDLNQSLYLQAGETTFIFPGARS